MRLAHMSFRINFDDRVRNASLRPTNFFPLSIIGHESWWIQTETVHFWCTESGSSIMTFDWTSNARPPHYVSFKSNKLLDMTFRFKFFNFFHQYLIVINGQTIAEKLNFQYQIIRLWFSLEFINLYIYKLIIL